MTRNETEEMLALEREASELGYVVVQNTIRIREFKLSDQFHWIAGQLAPQTMSERTPAERKPVRQEISKRIKELSDVVREKHIQYNLSSFRCIDLHDECVRNRKKQKKSPYLCFLALFICLAKSMKFLLAAIAATAATGGHLR